MRVRHIEIAVGAFMIAGFLAFIILAFKVSGLTTYSGDASFRISAAFDNVGDLKVRAPVTLAGVKIGEVTAIKLDPKSLSARVDMRIISANNQIPMSSSARILTQGILGSNYVGLTPGFDDDMDEAGEEKVKKPKYLHEGSEISDTTSAIILENLIGQLMFNINKK